MNFFTLMAFAIHYCRKLLLRLLIYVTQIFHFIVKIVKLPLNKHVRCGSKKNLKHQHMGTNGTQLMGLMGNLKFSPSMQIILQKLTSSNIMCQIAKNHQQQVKLTLKIFKF